MFAGFRNIIIIICLMLMAIGGQSQNHYLLEGFKAHTDGSRVILVWTMKKGAACTGIGILRSVDGIQFEQIGIIDEVCGSFEFAKNYTFTDEAPVPDKINYYVLQLGFTGKTEPPLELNFIDFSNKTSVVVPNPGKNVVIHFYNPDGKKYRVDILSYSGKLIYTHQTTDAKIHFDAGKLIDNQPINQTQPQMLIYRITDEKGSLTTSGKFYFTDN